MEPLKVKILLPIEANYFLLEWTTFQKGTQVILTRFVSPGELLIALSNKSIFPWLFLLKVGDFPLVTCFFLAAPMPFSSTIQVAFSLLTLSTL